MLRISQQQMDTLSSAMYARFEAALAKHLRVAFPAQTAAASDEQLLGAIRFVVEEGKRYGIVLQEDLRRFMELFLSHGPDFLNQPRFAALLSVLSSSTMDGTEKMDLIDMLEPGLLGGAT